MIYLREVKKKKEDINSLRKRTREELKKDIEDLNKKKDLFNIELSVYKDSR